MDPHSSKKWVRKSDEVERAILAAPLVFWADSITVCNKDLAGDGWLSMPRHQLSSDKKS